MINLEQQLGRSLDQVGLLSRRRRRELELVQSQPVLPGVRDYLESARKMRLRVGLASSSPCEWVVGHLERLDLIGYFDAIAASDDVARTKPDPALYRTAVEWLEVAPDEAVAFEDSLNGLIAAKRAGLYCVVILNALTQQLDLMSRYPAGIAGGDDAGGFARQPGAGAKIICGRRYRRTPCAPTHQRPTIITDRDCRGGWNPPQWRIRPDEIRGSIQAGPDARYGLNHKPRA
jgi:HAD superfamily hydrolase (TIGR01509 family)